MHRYFFECSICDNVSNDLIKRYYYRNPNTYKLQQLMNTTNKYELLKLDKMFKIILLGLSGESTCIKYIVFIQSL